MGFYEGIAARYDQIVDSGEREASARRFVGRLLEGHAVGSALDVACGTGLYARALAERGVQVTAADLSEAMLHQGRARAPAGGAPITWLQAPMQEIAERVRGPFDAVLCMGNSLPHLLEDGELAKTLRGFRRLLSADGVVVAQVLNYDRILAERRRVVGVTRVGETEYIRFYDFLPGQVRFNVLEIRWQGDQARHELHETALRPYGAAEIAAAASDADFAAAAVHGGLEFEPFEATSESVVLIASA